MSSVGDHAERDGRAFGGTLSGIGRGHRTPATDAPRLSVLIRVHPWLLTPRSDSGALSFVFLGVDSWLPGLGRVFHAFRGPATGLAVIASSAVHARPEPIRFPDGQPLSSTPVK